MKKITKLNSKKFYKEMKIIFAAVKAVQTDDNEIFTKFSLNTKVGILNIMLSKEQIVYYSVDTKFEDIPKAKELNLTDFNPHSGKWNFNYDSMEYAILRIYAHLRSVL